MNSNDNLSVTLDGLTDIPDMVRVPLVRKVSLKCELVVQMLQACIRTSRMVLYYTHMISPSS